MPKSLAASGLDFSTEPREGRPSDCRFRIAAVQVRVLHIGVSGGGTNEQETAPSGDSPNSGITMGARHRSDLSGAESGVHRPWRARTGSLDRRGHHPEHGLCHVRSPGDGGQRLHPVHQRPTGRARGLPIDADQMGSPCDSERPGRAQAIDGRLHRRRTCLLHARCTLLLAVADFSDDARVSDFQSAIVKGPGSVVDRVNSRTSVKHRNVAGGASDGTRSNS